MLEGMCIEIPRREGGLMLIKTLGGCEGRGRTRLI